MSAAQHQRHGRLFHAGNQLGNGKPRLDISTDGVENNHQPFDGRVLFDGDQLRNDVLILGGLVLRRQDIVTLDLTDDGQTVDDVLGCGHGDRAGLDDLAGLLLQILRLLLRLVDRQLFTDRFPAIVFLVIVAHAHTSIDSISFSSVRCCRPAYPSSFSGCSLYYKRIFQTNQPKPLGYCRHFVKENQKGFVCHNQSRQNLFAPAYKTLTIISSFKELPSSSRMALGFSPVHTKPILW